MKARIAAGAFVLCCLLPAAASAEEGAECGFLARPPGGSAQRIVSENLWETRFHVVLPVGYDGSREPAYPVLYLLYAGAKDSASCRAVSDLLGRATKQLGREDLILVLVEADRQGPPWNPARVRQLVPYIHSTYRTLNPPRRTFVSGNVLRTSVVGITTDWLPEAFDLQSLNRNGLGHSGG